MTEGNTIDVIARRALQDGVMVNYIMPARAGSADALPTATLDQAHYYCVTHREIASAKLAAFPGSAIYAHEAAIFAGMARLIEACQASDVIKDELRHVARARVAAEAAAKEAARVEAAGDVVVEPEAPPA